MKVWMRSLILWVGASAAAVAILEWNAVLGLVFAGVSGILMGLLLYHK
jgi:hypothetical protein